MTKQEFEDLCAQSGLAETQTASVLIEYKRNDQDVSVTVSHKTLAIEPCSAYHPLSDDEYLTESVQRFAQFIASTADVSDQPAPL